MDTASENKENVTRACLQLNEKSYSISKGHNTIGRNPDAVVNIKNINISKNHAIITVIHEDHYLSDFKSSNGTYLNSKKLIPLQLYELQNGASIKFGDVFCTYKKLNIGENFRKSVAVESQACGEEFYGSATQEVLLPNIPEGINFNELPTQMFSNKDLGINEMPTQAHNFSLDESSNDSIDYLTMQNSSESQVFNNLGNGNAKTNANILADSDTDDDLSTSVVRKGTKKLSESDTEDDLSQPSSIKSGLRSEPSSQIHPVGVNSRKIVDDETDIDLTPSGQIKPVMNKKNVIESDSSDTEDSLPCDKSRYHISDDSDTEIEDEVKKNDEETKIDDQEDETLPNSSERKEENSMSSFRLSLNESVPNEDEDKRRSGSSSKVHKKVLPQDHHYCQSFTDTQEDFERLLSEKTEDKVEEERNVAGTSELNSKEESEDKHETDNKSDSERTNLPLLQSENEEDKIKELVDVTTSAKESEEEITPDLHSRSEENDKSDNKHASNLHLLQNENENEEKIEELFDVTTTAKESEEEITPDLHSRNEENDNKSDNKHASNVHLLQNENENEDKIEELFDDERTQAFDFDVTTSAKEPEEQITPNLHSGNEKTEEKPIAEKAPTEAEAKKDEDLFLQPTQTFEDQAEESVSKQVPENFLRDEDDEIFMQSTQMLEGSLNKPSSSIAETSKDEDIFLNPTQALESLHDDQTEDHIPIQETFTAEADTQTLQSILEDEMDKAYEELAIPLHEKTNEDEDEDILPPTQALERLHGDIPKINSSTEEKEDRELPATQQLESLLSEEAPSTSKKDVFLSPPLFKSPSPKKPRKKDDTLIMKKSSIEDDEDFLQPTQALEVMHEDGTPFNKIEDELHQIFASQSMLCTQQLVDVLDTSDNDVIEDSILEKSRTSLSLRNPEPLTAESVKKILADEDEDEEIKMSVNKAETSKVKTYSRKKNDSLNEEMSVEKNKKEEPKEETTQRGRRKREKESEETPAEKEETVVEENKKDKNEEKKQPTRRGRRKRGEDENEAKKIEESTATEKSDNEENEKTPAVRKQKDENKVVKEETTTRRGRRKRGEEDESKKIEANTSIENEEKVETPVVKKQKDENKVVKEETTRKGRRKRGEENEVKKNEESTAIEKSDNEEKEETPAVKKQKGETEVVKEETTRRGRRKRGEEESESNKIEESATTEKSGNEKETFVVEKQKDENKVVKEETTRKGRPKRGQENESKKTEESMAIEKSYNEENDETPAAKKQKNENKVVKEETAPRGRRKRGEEENESQNSQESLASEDTTSNSGDQKQKKVGRKQKLDIRKENSEETEEVLDKKEESKGRKGRKLQKKASEEKDSEDFDNEDAMIIEDKNEINTQKGKRKQNLGNENEENLGENEDSQGTRKSKRKQIATPIVKEPEVASTRSKSKVAKNEDSEEKPNIIAQKSEISKNDTTNKRGKKKQEVAPEKVNDEDSICLTPTNTKVEDKKVIETTRKRGRKNEESVPETDDDNSQGTKRSTRKKQNISEDEEPNTTTRSNKRKQDTKIEIPQTPTKKAKDNNKKKTAPPSTPKKRLLELPTYDSEDEFDMKIPEKSPKFETPAPVRKSSRRVKGSEEKDDLMSISSTSSDQSSEASRGRRLSANSRRQKREEEEETKQKSFVGKKKSEIATPLATPRNRRVAKPKVVFTMMDSPELESLIRQLGGSVVDSVEACTVLVTTSVKRSQKLLCAVAQGKPICSADWLYACKKASSFVDPWDHILIDKEAEKKWNFSLRESLKIGSQAKLLEDYTFHLIVNAAEDAILKAAITACGGKWVAKNFLKSDGNLVIVSSENNRNKYSKIVKQNQEVKVVTPEAIFDGTLRQNFKFNEFLLN